MSLNIDKEPLAPDNRLVSYRFFNHLADFLTYIQQYLQSQNTPDELLECEAARERYDRLGQTFSKMVNDFRNLAWKCKDSPWGNKTPHLLNCYRIQSKLKTRALCGDGADQIGPYLKTEAILRTFETLVLVHHFRTAAGIERRTILERLAKEGVLMEEKETVQKVLTDTCRGRATRTLVADTLLDLVLPCEADRIQALRIKRENRREHQTSNEFSHGFALFCRSRTAAHQHIISALVLASTKTGLLSRSETCDPVPLSTLAIWGQVANH